MNRSRIAPKDITNLYRFAVDFGSHSIASDIFIGFDSAYFYACNYFDAAIEVVIVKVKPKFFHDLSKNKLIEIEEYNHFIDDKYLIATYRKLKFNTTSKIYKEPFYIFDSYNKYYCYSTRYCRNFLLNKHYEICDISKPRR
jgi:hypothetical protein